MQRFIDGVGEIRLAGGMVRMELVTLSATDRDDEGNPRPEVTEQLLLSPEGFIRMFGTLADTVRQMEADGLLVRDDAQPAAAPAADAGGDAPSSSGSPNFG